MSQLEPPLERLNYFNGQRLEAADLRLEQSYQMRVRRLLNKSLYTWGIAAGLEVSVKPGDDHKVIVSPGLALDQEGQEIILIEPQEVQVAGSPSPTVGVVFGNYLVIEYAEQKVVPMDDCCTVQVISNGNGKCKGQSATDMSWGGPTRIRCAPRLSFQNTWPKADSLKIVLAQVELDDTCAVRTIRSHMRKYVNAAEKLKVRAYALEGEKDIDHSNPKELYFHVDGAMPNSALLYLRGSKFSSLYYTEMGSHTHQVSVNVQQHAESILHHHTLKNGETDEEPEFLHTLFVEVPIDPPTMSGFALSTADNRDWIVDNSIGGPKSILAHPAHSHKFTNVSTDDTAINVTHDHNATATVANAGQNMPIRLGNVYGYANHLRVEYDGTDITQDVLAQLNWQELGDGTVAHDLVAMGTGAIDLMLLGVDLSPGQHIIKLSVVSGGGKIHYNLYVE